MADDDYLYEETICSKPRSESVLDDMWIQSLLDEIEESKDEELVTRGIDA